MKVTSTPGSKLCVLDVGFSSALIASLCATRRPQRKKGVSFIICSAESDRTAVRLQLSGHPDYLDHSLDNTKKVRAKNYQAGGVFLVTKMKFVLDVLEGLVDPLLVEQVLLVNEHCVSNYNPLAVAVNLLKRFNNVKTGHSDGLSDSPGERHLSPTLQGAIPVDDGQPLSHRLSVLAGISTGGQGVPSSPRGRPC